MCFLLTEKLRLQVLCIFGLVLNSWDEFTGAREGQTGASGLFPQHVLA